MNKRNLALQHQIKGHTISRNGLSVPTPNIEARALGYSQQKIESRDEKGSNKSCDRPALLLLYKFAMYSRN